MKTGFWFWFESDNEFINNALDKNHENGCEYHTIDYRSDTESVTLENEINLNINKPNILALQTDFSEPSIYNNEYNSTIAYFNSRDVGVEVAEFNIKNPAYYETTIEKFCKSSVTIIDIATKKQPFFSDGSPTYIKVFMKPKTEMGKAFNIFLDSSDKKSKLFYPKNNESEFEIQLPQRLEFNKNWEVCLKTIFLGNDVFNIYEDK